MKIGIDIDDTTLLLENEMIKYADIYDKKFVRGTGRKEISGLIPDAHFLEVLYDWTHDEKMMFFDTYYKNILENCTLIPNADEVCQKLKRDGHSIYFISARFSTTKNCDAKQITINSLNNFYIPYDELIVNAKNKLKICKEKEIDLFIDDNYKLCLELSENGIKSLLMTTKMNKNIDCGNIPRIHDWNEIYKVVNTL